MRVIRPPDIYVGGLIFYRDSSFFFFRHLIAELTERNTTKIGHVLGIFLQFEHACPKPGVLPLQIGAQKHFLGRLRNLMAILTAYIFGTKQSAKCVDDYEGSPT